MLAKNQLYISCVAVDLTKRQFISNDPAKKIADLLLWARQSAQELDWWFELRGKTAYPKNLPLRKPICIELYEFALYLTWAINQIRDVVNDINILYSQAGHGTPLEHLDRKHLKILKAWKKKLEKPRNHVAAHRYTSKSGIFLTLNDVSRALKGLDWQTLNAAYKELKKVHDTLIAWHQKPKNRNNLVIAKIARQSRKIP